MKIAFIEDDADSLMIFAKRFRESGIRCDPFRDAESAFSLITPGSHDALVLDIRLPGMSGLEFLESLRARGVHTPAVLITAFSSKALATQALNTSANYLLEKPFSFDALRKVLTQITEHPASLQHCVERGLSRLDLTSRESEVAKLLLKGLTNAEIARVTALSEKTVKQYLTQLFEKAAVSSRAEFFSYIFPV